MKNEFVLHYYATSKCKMTCPFCYSLERGHNNETLDIKKIEELLIIAKSFGAKGFVMTGGDPFEREDLPEILEVSKKLGYSNRIDSNMLSFTPDKFDKISNNIDCIGIPLDGFDDNSHDLHRKFNGHFRIIINAIDTIKKRKQIDLKINTLLSKQNYLNVQNMSSLIQDISPKIWSIYVYKPIGIGVVNSNLYEISQIEFNSMKSSVIKQINSNIRVDFVGFENHAGSYVLVTSDGRVYGQKPNEYFYNIYGQFSEDSINSAIKNLDINGNQRRLQIVTGNYK